MDNYIFGLKYTLKDDGGNIAFADEILANDLEVLVRGVFKSLYAMHLHLSETVEFEDPVAIENKFDDALVDRAARAFMSAYHGRDLWDEIVDDDSLTPRANTLRAIRAALAAASPDYVDREDDDENSFIARKLKNYHWMSIEESVYDTSGEVINGGSSGSRIEYYANIFSSVFSNLESMLRSTFKVASYLGEDNYSYRSLDLREDFYNFNEAPEQLNRNIDSLVENIEELISMDNFRARSIVYRVDEEKRTETRRRIRRIYANSMPTKDELEEQERKNVQKVESRNAALANKVQSSARGSFLGKLFRVE